MMAQANPGWGYTRIRGALYNLAHEIGRNTIKRILLENGLEPAPERASRAVDVPVIASGGVGTLEHLAEGLVEGEADAVLAASIFHFGTYSVRAVKDYLAGRGIPVRR